jgi:mannose-1-phosphate guanylyltransferase/mannose-6-phosphate isomerase
MLHPVIMCGGSGVRLWPASTPARPKPFIPLISGQSTFGMTLARIAGLDAAPPLVVAGAGHAGLIEAELARQGMTGLVVIEPEGRDSAPAMAAAAELVRQEDPDGVCVFLAADHDIPEPLAFARVAAQAAALAAGGGIVTLGVSPTGPSTAYGYIQPGEPVDGGEARRVKAFVEKPDRETAEGFLAQGFLWNSGMFICRADVLLEELRRHAPEVARHAAEAVAAGDMEPGRFHLGAAFSGAPRISIDYAVLEHTDKALVLPAAFAWSDLGAWDAVLEQSPRDADGNYADGTVYLQGAQDCLVRAAPGVTIAAAGVRNLAIIAEAGAVMVCDLDNAGDLKALIERVRGGAAKAPTPTLADIASRFETWLTTAALPLWWTLGADHANGGFHEEVGADGRTGEADRRLRVQGRQTHVFARAGLSGWSGPWRQAVEHGLDSLKTQYRRDDGLYRTLVTAAGAPKNEDALLYDQAFVLLALASAKAAGVRPQDCAAEALSLLTAVRREFSHPTGGFREVDQRSFQSNPQMHLFEAALAWLEVDPDPAWRELAGELAELTLVRLVDADGGPLREFFDSDWSPADGRNGGVVEPGHQFEWAGLLARWAKHSGDPRARVAAEHLYDCGARGVDSRRGAAIDEMDTAFRWVRRTARLWPQTERVKAAALLSDLAPAGADRFKADMIEAAQVLWRYLETPVAGLWWDQMDFSSTFQNQASPASSLYHIVGAVEALSASRGEVEPV